MDSNKSTNNPTTNIFGSSANAASPFGNPSASASKPPTAFSFSSGSTNLFGSTSALSTTPQSSPAKTNIFGTASSSTTGSIFGNTTNPTTTSASSPFGNTSKIAPSSGSASNIFGTINSATPSASTPTSSSNPASNAGNLTPVPPSLFGSNTASNSTSNIFSNPTTTPTTGSTSTTSNLFGSKPSTNAIASPFGNATTTTNSSSAPATVSSSGFGSPATTQPLATTAGNSPAASPFASALSHTGTTTSTNLFGAKPSDLTTSNKSNATTAPTGASTLSATNLFSAKSTAPVKSSPLAMNTPTTAQPSSSAQPAPPSTPKPPSTSNQSLLNKPNINLAPSLLKGKTLEDLVGRWNSELDERVEDFKHTANEIAAWDQVLIQNGDQISVLYDELQRIDPIQSSIEQTLDYVETQQVELATALDDYERQLSNQPQDLSVPGRLRTTAQERQQAYRTAEEVHVQLNDMASSLGTMIAELNMLAGPGRSDDPEGTLPANEDPLVQIGGILNAHLNSLNWIGEIAQELGTKVNELESRVTSTKVEFGLDARQLDHSVGGTDENMGALGGLGHSNRILPSHLTHPRR
ncbi:hypothetical protein O181_049208 [Austropuccinia psidii MF-1]|uniref:Nucleoporin NSP1 n=1 Tax=Austropuccinia psidii MF-1 TaxID=1389203 RepID=A0A9Q3DX19_9BASI|nr:hypothetical protein [Austropuccinia psidii MF-1]